MSNFNEKIINNIQTNGFCKIDNFFKEEDLKNIDLKLKQIKEKKISLSVLAIETITTFTQNEINTNYKFN